MNQDIIALQERIAHQERMLQEISAVAYRQQQQLDRMEQQIAQLRDKLRSYNDGQSHQDIAHQPPPHY